MYLLEGTARWNIDRAQQMLNVHSSGTRMYDIHLMSNVNDASRSVLGQPLLPEFMPPRKPTGKIFKEKRGNKTLSM